MKDYYFLSYFLLFLKFQLVINDSSYFYLLTNILGAILLFYVSKNKKQKNSFLFLGLFMGINLFLLGLRLFDINVAGIPSVVFAIFIWVCYLYDFIYPVVSFSEWLKDHDNRTVQRLIKTMTFLSAFLLLTAYLFYQLTPLLMVAIIAVEFITLIKVYRLHKNKTGVVI